MIAEKPLVSIITPVYNCAPYLSRCLESVLSQTYANWELICIDDGSSDDSWAVLEGIAAKDDRIRIVKQVNAGPGRTRNNAIAAAKGEFVAFLDADDFMEPMLLEKAVGRMVETSADLVVWDMWLYSDKHQCRQDPYEKLTEADSFGNNRDTFSWRDNPKNILLSFQNWPWNKLYRMSFVVEHQLRFQEDITHCEDVMFACQALVLAQKIAYIDERLSNYRVDRSDSTMATKDARPFDFYDAILNFKAFLEQRGLYEQLEQSYVIWAASNVIYSLRTTRHSETFNELFEKLHEGGLAEIGLLGHERAYYENDWLYNNIELIRRSNVCDVAFALWREAQDAHDCLHAVKRQQGQCIQRLEAEKAELERELWQARSELHDITVSAEYRYGKKMLVLPRRVVNVARKNKG